MSRSCPVAGTTWIRCAGAAALVVLLASCAGQPDGEPRSDVTRASAPPDDFASPSTQTASTSSAVPTTSDDAPTPTATMLTNSPVFDDWNDVFRFASVTVEGTITQRLDTVTMPDDPAVEDIGWAIWELEVNDPIGADVPTTLRVVDFDRNGTQVIDGALPVVEEGLTGIFALDTADAGQRVTFPEVGSTYYPVVILEQTPQGYEHTVGTLPPLESLDDIREAVAADNARNS